MATSEWIESADTARRGKPAGNHFSDHLLAMAAQDHAAAQLERQRAARCVRRLAPDDAAGVLEILGLDAAPPEPTAQPTPPTPPKAPPAVRTTPKRCPDCRQTKDPDEFHRNARKHDGLSVYCKPCARVRRRSYP